MPRKSTAQLNRETDAFMAARRFGSSHRGRSHMAVKSASDWSAFVDGAAFAFFASPYITEVENLYETAREQDDPKKRVAYEAAHRALSPGPGGNWERVMPATPASAVAVAKKFTKAVREKLSDAELAEVFSKFSARDAGYYGAMQSQGEGVGWFDEGVKVDPPDGFQWDPKLTNAIYAAVAKKVREAGIKLPRQ